jgi:hypothetical protein
MEIVGIFYGKFRIYYVYLVYFMTFGNLVIIWYILPRFGILCQQNLATLFTAATRLAASSQQEQSLCFDRWSLCLGREASALAEEAQLW